MARLQIAMVAGEAVPFAKVGGLADVIGALPVHLEKLGASVSIVIPRYRAIDLDRFGFKPYVIGLPTIPVGFESVPFTVHRGVLPRSAVPVYLIGSDQYFDRDGIYIDPSTGRDFPDQADRWIFFQRAALEFLRIIQPSLDILHCHDHQTGLIPAYLRRIYRSNNAFARTGSIFTIHNMGYQGLFPPDIMKHTGFNLAEFYPGSPFEFYGLLNFMKPGITLSDLVTTVSETYASEIQQSGEFGYGLQDVLRNRSSDLVGILNGIDYDVWNPEHDPLLPAPYSDADLSGKRESRKALLAEFGLSDQPDRPIFAMISRIDVQKGFDLVVRILDGLLSDGAFFIMLGSGNKETETALREIISLYPDRAAIRTSYDNDLAHVIEAGADIFLMPSKYEPCGLNQMYSMRYGTAPVVRATGGLADTVKEFDPSTGQGSGFVFLDYDPGQFRDAIDRAWNYWTQPELWRQVVVNGMNMDLSWSRSAARYMDAYKRVSQTYQSNDSKI